MWIHLWVNMSVHWGWYVQICGVSYGENISYLMLKCSPTTCYLNLVSDTLWTESNPSLSSSAKAGFGEEVSVVEGLGCIIGRLFSLLAIDWSCLGLAADQSLFIRSRKRLWIWKKKKRLMLKNVFHMWGKITLWIFFFKENIFQSKEEKYAAVGKNGLCVQT